MTTPTRFNPRNSRLYVSTPVTALVEGLYEENVPVAEILTHGDFGLGTFNELDGEMVLLDGRAYRVAADGSVTLMSPETRTPFAAVTFFKPMSHERAHGPLTHDQFLAWLAALMPSPNIFYAFRIEGTFSQVRTRSVPKSANYRPLVEVTRDQPEFLFGDTRGTLAGFYTPAFMGSVAVPGVHLHYLSEDKTQGGHLLTVEVAAATAEIQFLYTVEVGLPVSVDYLLMEMQRDVRKDLEEAEH